MADFEDGEVVAYGDLHSSYLIRHFTVDGEEVFDWIVESTRGDYQESDEYFDSIDEAKADLGVRH